MTPSPEMLPAAMFTSTSPPAVVMPSIRMLRDWASVNAAETPVVVALIAVTFVPTSISPSAESVRTLPVIWLAVARLISPSKSRVTLAEPAQIAPEPSRSPTPPVMLTAPLFVRTPPAATERPSVSTTVRD